MSKANGKNSLTMAKQRFLGFSRHDMSHASALRGHAGGMRTCMGDSDPPRDEARGPASRPIRQGPRVHESLADV
jgi:hypothetical protein